MDQAQALRSLAECLAGSFQNRKQALADPTWYVHFRIWMRPVALFTEDSVTLFIEQASAAYAQPPYRQRVLRLSLTGTDLTAEYYALKDPSQFQGATQAVERLRQMTVEDLVPLQGSRLKVVVSIQHGRSHFEARHYPGERCEFSVNGEAKVVELAFDAIAPSVSSEQPAQFLMYDKGIDPATGNALWGAKFGPFNLEKDTDYSAELLIR